MKVNTLVISVVVVVVVVAIAAVYLATAPATTPTSTTTQTTTTTPEETIKVALICDAPLNDVGWNAMAWEGMVYIRDELGGDVSYSESVGEADSERVVREYAAAGYDLIIGHSFGFQAALFATAPDYPDLAFAWNDGYETATNVCVYEALSHEAGYLAGMLAAGMTETGIVGAQAGMQVPDVNRTLNGFILGAKAMNPDVQVLTTYIGTWVDTGKSKEAALAMIDAGADVLLHASSSAGLGAIEAGRDRGIMIIGDTADQYVLGPEVMLTSVLMKWSKPVIDMAQDVIDGAFEGKFYSYSMPTGGADIAPYHDFDSVIPQELKDLIAQTKADIISGELVVERNDEPPE